MQTIHMWMFFNLLTILLHVDNGLMSGIRVFQSPDAINATEGGSVQLNCTFEANGTAGGVVWRRASQNTEVSVRDRFYQSRITKSGAKLFAERMAFLEIINLTKMDSDIYYCEVEIVAVGKASGTGTQLIITDTVTVGKITVIQSPQALTRPAGQTADLLCRYEGPTAIGSYTWHRGTKQGNEVSNNTAEYRGRVFGASKEDFSQRGNASIRIIQLKPEDAGFYFCKVQLVGFAAADGPGTRVTVERRQYSGGESSHGESAPMIPPLVYTAVAVPLLIIVIITVVISRHRKRVALQQPTSPDPFYSEIHETERNYESSECRRTNRREGDDKLQYPTVNVQDSNQTERRVKREAVLYASVK